MIKGCSKLLFFGVILFAALYYFFSHYEINIFSKAEENIKEHLSLQLKEAFTSGLSDVKIETNKLDLNEITDWLDRNSSKLDTKFIEDMYEDFSKFISDKVLDAEEIKSLKNMMKNYEK